MNEMIMVCHSLINNTGTGLTISLFSNTNPLISLIPTKHLNIQTFTQLWYFSTYTERRSTSETAIEFALLSF